MAAVKRNNIAVRSVIVVISALASVGIWAAVTRGGAPSVPSPDSSTSTRAAGDPNFSANDGFLTQGATQVSPGNSGQYSPQRAPAPRLRTRAS